MAPDRQWWCIVVPMAVNIALFGDYPLAALLYQVLVGTTTVTPSVLHPKQTTKPCHEHHVYVIKHVIKCVDQFLVT